MCLSHLGSYRPYKTKQKTKGKQSKKHHEIESLLGQHNRSNQTNSKGEDKDSQKAAIRQTNSACLTGCHQSTTTAKPTNKRETEATHDQRQAGQERHNRINPFFTFLSLQTTPQESARHARCCFEIFEVFSFSRAGECV